MAAFLGLGIILYIVIGHFVKPIGDLNLGAASIGSGDLNHRVEIKSEDEIGQLANAFNQMASDLQIDHGFQGLYGQNPGDHAGCLDSG